MEGSTYYVTFRLLRGALSPDEVKMVLHHIKSGDTKFYWLLAATVMPDHTHLILRPREGWSLSRIMKGTKGVSSRLLNQSRNTQGSLWQEESWDRIIRDENEMLEKVNYMFMNAVKKGLVENPNEYPGWYMNLKPT